MAPYTEVIKRHHTAARKQAIGYMATYTTTPMVKYYCRALDPVLGPRPVLLWKINNALIIRQSKSLLRKKRKFDF